MPTFGLGLQHDRLPPGLGIQQVPRRRPARRAPLRAPPRQDEVEVVLGSARRVAAEVEAVLGSRPRGSGLGLLPLRGPFFVGRRTGRLFELRDPWQRGRGRDGPCARCARGDGPGGGGGCDVASWVHLKCPAWRSGNGEAWRPRRNSVAPANPWRLPPRGSRGRPRPRKEREARRLGPRCRRRRRLRRMRGEGRGQRRAGLHGGSRLPNLWDGVPHMLLALLLPQCLSNQAPPRREGFPPPI
mmetsp:Transcript_147066/g.472287  ORF Transcript_147066/g.472287 Transcript_147066/m.472287 type:complete len:242 (+) Transcript_147066:191-916(+)